MESNKPLAQAGYLLGLLLIVIPLFDAGAAVWPPHFADERWRYGAVGALSNLTLVPLLGFFVVLAIAVFMDHRRIRRTVGIICGIFALILAAAAVLFILDYFQTRTIIRPQFQNAMGVATGTALAKHLVTIVTLALLTRVGLSGPRPVAARKVVRPVDSGATPIVTVPGAARAE